MRRRSRERLVYFIQIGADGPIKIGSTGKPVQHRLWALQLACPWPLRLLATVADAAGLESRLHRRFSEHRMRGEWFVPASPVLEFIAKDCEPAPPSQEPRRDGRRLVIEARERLEALASERGESLGEAFAAAIVAQPRHDQHAANHLGEKYGVRVPITLVLQLRAEFGLQRSRLSQLARAHDAWHPWTRGHIPPVVAIALEQRAIGAPA